VQNADDFDAVHGGSVEDHVSREVDNWEGPQSLEDGAAGGVHGTLPRHLQQRQRRPLHGFVEADGDVVAGLDLEIADLSVDVAVGGRPNEDPARLRAFLVRLRPNSRSRFLRQ
jgi:hypothetical protein